MILFRQEHVAPILEGRKTQTRRLGRRRWRIDAVHQARTRMLDASSTFARLHILDVRSELIGDISAKDARAEGYASPGAFIDAFWRINPPRPLVPGLVGAARVWVVEFEVVP